jgi:hypothetical protein
MSGASGAIGIGAVKTFRRAGRTPSGVVLVALLVLALWAASTLGLLHRTLHLPAMPGAAWVAEAGAPALREAGDASSAAPAGGTLDSRGGQWLAGLFAVHGDGDCRLYDQLAGGAAAPSVPFVLLPVTLPTARFHYFLGEALARWVALFDARGPPATR